MSRMLARHIWLGTGSGILLSLTIGGIFLYIWFNYASNLWSSAEALWEAILQLIACILMTIMGFAFLKSDELTAKWHRKLHKALQEHNAVPEEQQVIKLKELDTGGSSNPSTKLNGANSSDGAENSIQKSPLAPTPEADYVDLQANTTNKPNTDPELEGVRHSVAETIRGGERKSMVKRDSEAFDGRKTVVEKGDDETTSKATKKGGNGAQAFFWIPFVTVIREGLEGMLFLGGIAISEDPGHIPLAIIGALTAGLALGYAIFRAGNSMKLQTFFLSATITIFYLSSGLMAKSVWAFQKNEWNILIGSKQSVWHLNCCNPDDPRQGGWQLFNALFGWHSSPTIGSVTAYIIYWFTISGVLVGMKLMDRRRARLGREKVGMKRMIKEWIASFRG
ncbi:hypothetical protein BCR33DRAFT_724750 [Rhizoclosmatium globosum]|uniref:Iron permease FTR1 n=1 Tax=Rhizoclosmatium globosum TaxID=329046 RepID=A0A1Y2B3W3_9FUNG|nr:hypothetical protein BCR33DRAFT_724750 [Rhizoclosmatium globosum]|eukprot:ORY29240.1 hypothetical protein BCR33DRAFT_724750 [Rhizoclosmatium globosum]